MDIKFTVFATGATIIDNWLLYRAAESTSPGTIVKTAADGPPQTFPRPVFLANVRPVPHIVEIYSSTDGVSPDVLLSSFLYDPSFTNVEIRAALELVTDRGLNPYDPVEGQTVIGPIDGSEPGIPTIADWGEWWVELRSRGGRLRSDEYTKNGSNDGFTFPDGFYDDTIFICFPPKITTVTPTAVIPDRFTGYQRVTGSATVAPEWYTKYVDLVFDAPGGVITLQALADVPENRALTLYNMNGAQEQVIIRAAAGEFITWQDANQTELYIGKGESLELYKRTDNSDPDNPQYFWHVVSDLEGMKKVGLRVFGDTGIIDTLIYKNIGVFDGEPIPLILYPRLRWHVKRLPVGMVLPISSRTPATEGFWFYDGADLDSAENIFPPDAKGRHYRIIPGDKGNDSGRTALSPAGSLDDSHLMQHTHTPDPGAGEDAHNKLLRRSTGGAHQTAATFAPTGRPFTWPNITDSLSMTQGGDRPENTVLNMGVVAYFWL